MVDLAAVDIPTKLAAEAAGGLAAQLCDARQRLCWVNTGVLLQAGQTSVVTHLQACSVCSHLRTARLVTGPSLIVHVRPSPVLAPNLMRPLQRQTCRLPYV